VGPLLLALGVLAATWICVRLEGGCLADIRLSLNGQFAKQILIGLLSGIAVLVLAASLIWLCGGFRLEASPNALSNLSKAAAFEVCLAVMEELIYRGCAFQRAIRELGVPAAQVVLAILFCASHPLEHGMSLSSSLFAMGNLFLLALVAGACYIRTGSLAIPIGAQRGTGRSKGWDSASAASNRTVRGRRCFVASPIG
jgi:membrane protease YdiL (CAAX protease family)